MSGKQILVAHEKKSGVIEPCKNTMDEPRTETKNN